MCLIIARPRGADQIPAEYIYRAKQRNPHGFGITGKAPDGTIYLNKDFKMNDCVSLIRDYERQDMEFMAHFRWATHGTKNEENCHPFQIGNKLNYLMHNGIISVKETDPARSDTWHFTQIFAEQNLPLEAGAIEAYLAGVKQYLGGSKLVFLGEDTDLLIYNEEAGEYKGGVWYSNPGSIAEYKNTSVSRGSSYYGGSTGTYQPSRRFDSRRDFDEWLADAEEEAERAAIEASADSDEFWSGLAIEESLRKGEATIDDLAQLDVRTLEYIIEAYAEEVAWAIKDHALVKGEVEEEAQATDGAGVHAVDAGAGAAQTDGVAEAAHGQGATTEVAVAAV